MKIKNTDTPVLALGCSFAGIGVMRSLGSQGVAVYGVEDDPDSPALGSRYCCRHWIHELDVRHPERFLEFLMDISTEIGKRAVLIPTSDALSIFVADHRDALREKFLFSDNDPDLVRGLASKRQMLEIAARCEVPAPKSEFPQNIDDVRRFAGETLFPVMVKGIRGDLLQARTGARMVIAHSQDELLQMYKDLEDPDSPNLMLQEYIPGGDDEVYIFNGYFNKASECLTAFTGHKIRQFPVHVGCASLGRCAWNDRVAAKTIDFMKKLNYRGILDTGYRLDPRDGRYKVLDVNPRIGGAFRMFVGENGMDAVRALYLDLTGQEVPATIPRENRRWMIEDYDFISSYHYHKEGSLSFVDWLKSFRGLQEAKWFSWRDPVPFVRMCNTLLKHAGSAILKGLRPAGRQTTRSVT
jgi:predicted ATP-grasp superfamily ATP-dependent carboligase